MRLVRIGQKTEAGPADGPEWVDLDLDQDGAQEWLGEHLELSAATRELIAETATRRNLRVLVPEGLAIRLCYTREVGTSEVEGSEVRLGLLITPDRIVTIRRGKVDEIEALWDLLVRGKLEAERVFSVLAFLVSRIASRVETNLDVLSSVIDDLEDAVFDGDENLPIEELGQTRRQLIRDRRYITSLSRILEEIVLDRTMQGDSASNDELNAADQGMQRQGRTISFYLERANLLQDQIQSQLSERMNNATLRLGVVATVFLPLGFLTGLLGINVAGMPGSHNPEAFWMVCGLLLILAGGAWVAVTRFYRS